MYKKYLLLITIFLQVIQLCAQLEVRETSFKEVPGFVNINIDKMYDDNDKPYAVLKIKTENLNSKQRRELNFGGDAQTFFEVEYKDGEVWLYISYYASYIKISHEEFSSTEFYFPFDMKPKCGYELTLVNKTTVNNGWGSLTIITKPKNGADIILNGRSINQKSPYTNNMIPAGQYEISVSMDDFYTTSKMVNINDGDNIIVKIDMTSNIGKTYNEGAINGVFSVSSNKKVKFSKGNLQYQASTNTWRFAENQWDYVGTTLVYQGEASGTVPGSSNHLISSSYSGWIDLFGWGTSGYNGKKPYMTSSISSDYGDRGNNISDTNYDWGVYNEISNGSEKSWRTLTKDEWEYVFNKRSTQCGIRYVKAIVNNVNGIILFPDNWNIELYRLNNTNLNDALFYNNNISQKDWKNIFEKHGAVFLPVAGFRFEDMVDSIDSQGIYWTSTSGNNNDAYLIGFMNEGINTSFYDRRDVGHSVRLVSDND